MARMEGYELINRRRGSIGLHEKSRESSEMPRESISLNGYDQSPNDDDNITIVPFTKLHLFINRLETCKYKIRR